MLHCFRTLLLTLGLFFTGAAHAADPIVFTGYLHHDALNKDQVIRISIQKTLKLGATAPTYSAQVILYFGAPGGIEYTDMHYDPVFYNPMTRQFLFQRDDDQRGRRLPIIKLTHDEAGRMIEGTLTSMTEGYIGRVRADLGWDPANPVPEANLVKPLAGVYDATCNTVDGSALQLDDIEIVPSRIFADRVSPEGVFNTINYLGNGNCEHDGPVNCVSFTAGVYNFFRDEVHLLQGGWAWECMRQGDDDLMCDSPRYPHCQMSRRSRTIAPTEGQPVRTPVRPVTAPVPADHIPDVADCDAWQGTYSGTLTHALLGRTQPVVINFTSFMVAGPTPNVRCQIIGSAQLVFDDGINGNEVITFPVPVVDIDGTLADQTFYSDPYTDLVFDAHLENGVMSGAWYSKLFGYVGRYTVTRDAPMPAPTPNSIKGLKGHYVARNDTGRKMSLSSTEAGFDKNSHDPFHQIQISGTVTKEIVLDGRPILWPDSIQTTSYDYFTGYMTMRTGAALFYGMVGRNGMDITGIARGHMMVSHPFGYRYEFYRIPGN